MSAASILDSMVSVTSLNHGGASKALSQVGDNHPVVVLKIAYHKKISVPYIEFNRLSRHTLYRLSLCLWDSHCHRTKSDVD